MNDSLYHEKLLALAKSLRDDAPLPGATIRVRRDNPLCGDFVELSAQTAAGQIRRLAQRTRACILCEAATAQMLLLSADAETAYLRALCASAEKMFAHESAAVKSVSAESVSAEFAAFAPVIAHPARHECVLLPFRALSEILNKL